MKRVPTKVLLAAVAAIVIGAAVAVTLIRSASVPEASAPLSFRVDPAITPSLGSVAALEGGTGTRAVGAFAGPDGSVAELVLAEVIIHVRDRAELDAFLERWNGQVVDSFAADDDGQDHLVHVDLSRADPATLTADLLAAEPAQAGEHRAGDDRVLRLLALAASEWRRGTELVVNWLTEPTSIETGEAYESNDITKNVFDWSFMRSGGAMDTGVAAAWQLLAAKGKLSPKVRYMVVDGGFSANADFPENSKIRKADWGAKNPKDCTGGSPCPYHGTDVVLAGMARVDNKYGTAGPAGPVVSQLIAVGNGLDYWSIMRRTEKMAEQEKPDVVNMSFTRDVKIGSKHAKKWTDRRMRHVQQTGALIVAAAGNNGRTVDSDTLFIPCESTYVICVGGMDGDARVSSASNYGEGDSSTSVEIYGPMCVRSINDPNRSYLDYTTRVVCGTSVASPFVGGVAALVMAADPALGPEAVRKILNDTANVGGLGSKVTGSQRRVNALRAVSRALGVQVKAPKVSIEAPADGKQLDPENWMDLRGTATDFMGRSVQISWSSDRDGHLAGSSVTSVPALSVGTHIITASATDSTGRTGSAKVTVKVVDSPPKVKLVSPPSGMEVVEGSAVPLVAMSLDPDTYSAVPDKDATWRVTRSAAVVHTATGHSASLPAAKVVPGVFNVEFTAGGVSVHGSFTVVAVPVGQDKPTATIVKPASDLTLYAYNGAVQNVSFSGKGFDAQDGTLPGTRFRWTAYAGGKSKVLCVGSSVPGTGSGGFQAYKNCAGFTAQLGLVQGDLHTTKWVVMLEVFDSSGLPSTIDSVNVTVKYTTG